MSSQIDVVVTAEDCDKAASKLRDMVSTIEFTMISIIAGLMLFPWIDVAAPLIRDLRFEYWVYLAVGLVAIMFYWAAAINHTISFIGWPIDIIHSLLYLLFFPAVGLSIHFLADPEAWYPMFVAVMALAAILTSYDLTLIRARRREAKGGEAELLAASDVRQVTLVRLVFAAFLGSVLFAVLVVAFPDFFIGQHMHVLLGLGYVLLASFLLLRECNELTKIRPRILRRTAEEMARERVAGSRALRTEAAFVDSGLVQA